MLGASQQWSTAGTVTPRAPRIRSANQIASDIPPPAAGLALEHVYALTVQQQRIERRSLILGCVVTTLDAAPLREALADLVADISEAARTIGRLVQQATRGGDET